MFSRDCKIQTKKNGGLKKDPDKIITSYIEGQKTQIMEKRKRNNPELTSNSHFEKIGNWLETRFVSSFSEYQGPGCWILMLLSVSSLKVYTFMEDTKLERMAT